MHRVLRADERYVRQLFARKHLLARLKAHCIRHMVARLHVFAFFFNRLGNRRNHHLLWQDFGYRRIGVLAAAAQAADRHAHGIAHFHRIHLLKKRWACGSKPLFRFALYSDMFD